MAITKQFTPSDFLAICCTFCCFQNHPNKKKYFDVGLFQPKLQYNEVLPYFDSFYSKKYHLLYIMGTLQKSLIRAKTECHNQVLRNLEKQLQQKTNQLVQYIEHQKLLPDIHHSQTIQTTFDRILLVAVLSKNTIR